MIRIALDAMGGDHAPQAMIDGAIAAVQAHSDLEIYLFGAADLIESNIQAYDRLHCVPTTEVVTGDDEPVRAIRSKKDASMVVAARAVKDGQCDILVSAGNTGALLAAGLLLIGRIKNVDRPGLMPIVPTLVSQPNRFILIDAGANADSKPINLYQQAVLANFYAERVLGITSPRVGLINNGSEATKGSEVTKAAFQLLAEEKRINFIGNVEANHLLEGVCDIAVTDGFTGNAVLKTLEGSAKSFARYLKRTLTEGSFKTKLGAYLIQDDLKTALANLDDSAHGGAVLLGVKSAVIKAHGSSEAPTITSALLQACQVVDEGVVQQAIDFFQTLPTQE